MRKFIVLPLGLLILGFSCNKEVPAPVPQDALARVDNTFILQKDFDAALAGEDASYKKFLATDFGKDNMLNIMVRERLMQTAAQNSDTAGSEKYTKTVADIQKSFDRSLEMLKQQTLMNMWLEELKEKGTIKATKKEIDDYAKKYPYEFTIRHMLLAKADDANVVLRELKATSSANREKRFIELAKRFGMDPVENADKGKTVSIIPGEFITEIENAVANTPSNSVQGFFKSPRGFHIIYKVKEERINKKNAEPRIAMIIEQKKLDDYLNSLSEKYKVEVYKKYEQE
ncbi:parvulin-like peptidyl-prolyl isomerase [Elusimicrobium simillimum]|uniref:peptidylprolyl isomerase n=1 Tax=Elusimicrobium simillimum TaxID=3143438 RepID=UPI003C6F9923